MENDVDPNKGTRIVVDEDDGGATEAERPLRRPRDAWEERVLAVWAEVLELDAERLELDDALDQAFHPFWGSVFKAGGEVSSFGNQIEQYAGLYTARATNLTQYSPMHYFQSPRHRMPHEV